MKVITINMKISGLSRHKEILFVEKFIGCGIYISGLWGRQLLVRNQNEEMIIGYDLRVGYVGCC